MENEKLKKLLDRLYKAREEVDKELSALPPEDLLTEKYFELKGEHIGLTTAIIAALEEQIEEIKE